MALEKENPAKVVEASDHSRLLCHLRFEFRALLHLSLIILFIVLSLLKKHGCVCEEWDDHGFVSLLSE